MPSSLRVSIALVLGCPTFAFPAGVPAHLGSIHWVKLAPNTSSSVRQTTFAGHSGFDLRVTASFRAVNRRCAFLDHVNFYIYNLQPGGMGGGVAHVWNSSTQVTYDADRSVVYYSPATYRLGVSRWFCGGQSSGNASITIEKKKIAGCWSSCAGHNSGTVDYAL